MSRLEMHNHNQQGLLVTFCGLDGCGKTTMINKLSEEYGDSLDIVLTKQPTDFVRQSDIFRTYMDSPDHSAYDYRSLSLLAASDRVQHGSRIIEPLLEKGKVVFSDRYFYSCLANLRARGFYEDKWIYEVAQSIVKPDIAFFFDVSVETAVSRVRSREDEKNRYIDMDLQYRLKDEYLRICKENNGVLIYTECPTTESYQLVKTEFEKAVRSHAKQSD